MYLWGLSTLVGPDAAQGNDALLDHRKAAASSSWSI